VEPVVDEGLAVKFATEKDTPYTRWVAAEGLDLISGHYVPDLRALELKPWAHRGGRGVYLNHDASRTSNDCYVCEIPAGGELVARRQLCEEMILVLDGRGATRVWNDAGREVSFEWQAGSLFAIPVNTWHQHSNLSGAEPARFVASTNLPPVLNLYDDVDFVFDTSRDFPHKFNGEEDYFAAKTTMNGLLLDTNFVPDALALRLISAKERGAGGGHIRFSMAKGSMNSHISEFPVGTYKKGHRHGPGAHVIILSGSGYSLMWPEGEEPRRYDWSAGSLIVPPNMWYHQHFNTGAAPARYLAFKHEGVSIRNAQGVPKAWISRRLGGDQIDYADELPLVRQFFAEELAAAGVEPAMRSAYDAELPDLPPMPGLSDVSAR
jgi:oxalate decarboxylase/phosphoglucose isomerase-like protein (cupin superfamily)